MSATFKISGLQEKAPKLETAKSGSGKKYARISLTVTSTDGRKTWFNNIMLWDKMAEDYVSQVTEGSEVELEGNLYVKMEVDQANQKKAVIALDIKSFKINGSSHEEVEEEPTSSNEDEPDFDSMEIPD